MVGGRLIGLVRVGGYRAFTGYGTFIRGGKSYRIDTEQAFERRQMRMCVGVMMTL